MAQTNNKLNNAKSAKKDEFYTLYCDVENEMINYKEHFKNKIIYCNCDNPYKSNFFKYFYDNFNTLSLKQLICTSYNKNGKGLMCVVNKPNEELQITELNGNGDFRSQECTDILNQADIIITNPPFSLFRIYILYLIENKKDFITLGTLNGIKYKETFPLIKEGKMWLGTKGNLTLEFIIPEEYDTYTRIDENGNKLAKVPTITWFTNIHHEKLNIPLKLTKTYNEKEYQKYDNFDAINIDKSKDIPKDYYGIMGVPISFLTKYCPMQFEIVGEFNHGCDNEYDLAVPILNGKDLYPRIAIKIKKNFVNKTE